MHFFMQANKRSKHVSIQNSDQQEEHQQPQQNQQIQQKVVKKIVVRKKPKIQLDSFNDHVIQTQSHHFVDNSNQKGEALEQLKIPQRNKKTAPFISFMASDNESQDIKTPYLHSSSPTNNFETFKKTLQALPIQEVQDQHERYLIRTKSKPIEPIELETPTSKEATASMIRRNSMRTDFQLYQKKMNKYPTQISSQHDDVFSGYEQSRDGRQPKFRLKSNKQIEISILEGKNSEGFETSQVNQPFSSKSTKFQLRPQYFRSNIQQQQISERDEKLSISNHVSPLNQFTNRLTQVLQSSRSGSVQNTHRSNEGDANEQQTSNQNKRPSGYRDYIQKQSKQLQHQRQRMNYYSDEANKLLCNVDTFELSPNHMQVIVDKHYTPLKYMIEELVDLFCIGEVIKYQLKYRSYQILTKIFAQASSFYEQKIELQEPVKAYTFSLALKALLNEYEKSELDIIVTKIFQQNHVLSYQNFFSQFTSVLNSKLVVLLQPNSMKKQIDKTLQKVKSLFVIWIQTQYYTKKVKQILRSSKVVFDSILAQCSTIQQPMKLDVQMLQKFFLQGQRKNPIKKIKLDLFFRSLIGNDLLKSKWSDWIYKDEMRLYNRYESKLMYQRKHYVSKYDKKEIKTVKTIGNSRHDIKLKFDENSGSPKRVVQSRKVF